MKHLLVTFFIFLSFASAFSRPAYRTEEMQMEKLGRGVVAVRGNDGNAFISWRYLSSDPIETEFNIYRNGKLLTPEPVISTFYTDSSRVEGDRTYEIRPVVAGRETRGGRGRFRLPADSPEEYIEIKVDLPEDGITPAGDKYSYYPGDMSVGDVDGDGEYELVVLIEPDNRKDNSQDGYTGNVYIDCYKISGERLWRIDLGKNLRAGAHYTGILVYDFDGDGSAEVVTRTCDGTTDAKGGVIGDANADWREHGVWKTVKGREVLVNQGRILHGKDYLTVFSGKTGRALCSIDYIPQRGDPSAWGDDRANRSDRFLSAVAYLDGIHPSIVMCRGYYTRTVLAAFDWNGKQLQSKWVFDSDAPGNETYAGQGFHNLRVADVDGDGFDEIVYGSCTIDHDGTGLYSTGLGHGDAIHLTCFDPSSPELQVWDCHENKIDGSVFRDAASGNIIFQIKSGTDVGRCMAADIDSENYGVEMWSWCTDGIYNIEGKKYTDYVKRPPMSMAVWWDGDLVRELLNENKILKWNHQRKRCFTVKTFEGAEHINGSKATPCLQGDILGDWREEVVLISEDHASIRIYVSPIPTEYRFHTFLEDPVYRISIATQNAGYNQPTQPGFYFGPDLPSGIFRGYKIVR